MCQYCGCQSVTAIALLTREHDAALAFFAPLRAAAAQRDLSAAAPIAARLAILLEPHTEVEEDGLFSSMVEEFGDHVARLRSEHELVELVLYEIVSGDLQDEHWPIRLIEMLEVLTEHILAEQDGVFPAALTSLSGEQWAKVDAVRERVGTSLSDDGSVILPDADPVAWGLAVLAGDTSLAAPALRPGDQPSARAARSILDSGGGDPGAAQALRDTGGRGAGAHDAGAQDSGAPVAVTAVSG